jgi:hypothetical protein
VFLRVAATYRSDYLERVGDEPLEDFYFEDHLQWDLTTRYTVNDRWSAFANVVNGNNEPLGGRFGGSERTVRYETYSWSLQLGVEFVL